MKFPLIIKIANLILDEKFNSFFPFVKDKCVLYAVTLLAINSISSPVCFAEALYK